MKPLRVALVGDFNRRMHSHWATEASLFHAAAPLGLAVQPHWIATPRVEQSGAAGVLDGFDAIWGAPGSPYASMDGMLEAIRYARTRNVPYLGTCGGCQYALIEFTRNALGVADADSAENDSGSSNIVITPVYCSTDTAPSALPRLAGPGVAKPQRGTLLERWCGSDDLAEEYFCSFELNSEFVTRWQEAGLVVSARGEDGEVRAVELPDRRFYLAALFQPQLSSSFGSPHPIIQAFLRESANAE